jgi:hypothetical protein
MRWLDVSVTRAAFAAGALVLLLLAVDNRYGYSSLKGLVILAVIVILAGVTTGPGVAVGGLLAFVAYLVLNQLLGDALLAAAIVAILALILVLMERRGVSSLSRRRR